MGLGLVSLQQAHALSMTLLERVRREGVRETDSQTDRAKTPGI